MKQNSITIKFIAEKVGMSFYTVAKALNNDPFLFAEKYGDRIAFVGGLDARVLESNDLAIIRREVIDYVEGMKARGARLVFASDHSISTNVDYEDFKFSLEVYREHMMY